MLIVCPTCATTYQIQLAALGAAGRSVRCTTCKNTWFATPESVITEAEPEFAAASSVPPRPPATPYQSPEPQPPRKDDFADPADDFAASDFSVEGMMPSDDAEASETTGTGLAVMDAPPLAPGEQAEPVATKFDPGAPEDIETIAARRARHTYADKKQRRTPLQRIASMPVLIVLLGAALIAIGQARATVVRHFPQTGSLFSMLGMPVNLRGLTFEDVKSKSEFHDGVMVLVIEGVIMNLTRNTLEVPRLRFALRSGTGHEVYAWTALPSKNLLGSGDGLAFRTRLASPPPDGRDVIVRFFHRRDTALGSP